MSSAESDRDPLEILAAEFMERQRRGERPSVSEYTARHPELAADIEELFPTIAVMERLKIHKEQGSGTRVSLGGVRLERLGDFRIVGEIGRGGMGIVYEAFQESLGRHVAVKVLPRQSLLAPQQLRRFQREAQTAAKLHHTNIVPVFGVGEHEGFHYIVMQLIRGEGLDTVLAKLQRADGAEGPAPAPTGSSSHRRALSADTPPLSADEKMGTGSERRNVLAGTECSREVPVPIFSATEDFPGSGDTEVSGRPSAANGASAAPALREAWKSGPAYWRCAATMGLQVAEALHYAHGQHTLHRDIKPANLLLDQQGLVWITDFGLAKAMEQDNVTQTGAMAGTLRYMAPEQFSGQVDARSDIYSLGLTLYELLTLRPAFDDTNRSGLMNKIAHGEPDRPRKLDPRIPRDLETIVLKAIAREPADRYQTAGDLVRDLEYFLDDRPIRARRTSALERLWRWSRRNRALAALAASTLLLLVLVAVVASVGYARTTHANVELAAQRKKAEDNSALALEALDNIFQQFAPDRTVPASALLLVGDAGEEIKVPVQPVLSKEAAALLERMLAFYDRLAEQGGDDARLRRKVAEANRRVGDIRQRLGQFQESKAAYLRAIELYTPLARGSEDTTELRTEIARIHTELGNVYCAINDPRAGKASYLEALSALEAISAESAVLPQAQFELARAHYFLGRRSEKDLGPPPPGPGNRRGPRDDFRGPVFDLRGPGRRPDHARAKGSKEIVPSTSNENQDSPPLGPRAPFPTMAYEERDESLRKVLDLWQRLAADDPSRTPGPPNRADEGANGQPGVPTSSATRFAGPADGPRSPNPAAKPEEDDRSAQRAFDLWQHLVADDAPWPPGPPGPPRREGDPPPGPPGGPPSSLAMSREERGRNLQEAILLLEQLVGAHPAVPDYRHLLARCYRAVPPPRGSNPQTPDAANKAAAILEKLVADYPNVPDYRYDLSETYAMLDGPGFPSSALPGRPAESRSPVNLERALAISEALVAEHPNIPDYALSQVPIRIRLADILRDTDQTRAEANLRKALELQSGLVSRFPENSSYKFWMAIIHERLAGFLQEHDRLAEARDTLEKSVALLKELLQPDPRAGHIRGLLAHHYGSLADLYRRTGEEELSAQMVRQAEELRQGR